MNCGCADSPYLRKVFSILQPVGRSQLAVQNAVQPELHPELFSRGLRPTLANRCRTPDPHTAGRRVPRSMDGQAAWRSSILPDNQPFLHLARTRDEYLPSGQNKGKTTR